VGVQQVLLVFLLLVLAAAEQLKLALEQEVPRGFLVDITEQLVHLFKEEMVLQTRATTLLQAAAAAVAFLAVAVAVQTALISRLVVVEAGAEVQV